MFDSRLKRRGRRRLLLPVLALVAAGAIVASSPVLAEPVHLQNPSTRSQRPIADDPTIDQALVAPPSQATQSAIQTLFQRGASGAKPYTLRLGASTEWVRL